MDVETDIDAGLDPRHRKYASLLLARCLITLFEGPCLRKWVPTYKDIKCRDVLPFFIFVHTSYHVSSGVEQVMYPNFAANQWNHDPFWRKLPLLSETSPPRRKHSHVAILFQHRKPPIFFLGGPTKFPTFRRPSRRVPPFLPTQGVAFCSDLENPKELHRTFRIIGEGEDHQSLIHFYPFRGVLCCTHVGNTIMRFREWMVKRWNPETLKNLVGWLNDWGGCKWRHMTYDDLTARFSYKSMYYPNSSNRSWINSLLSQNIQMESQISSQGGIHKQKVPNFTIKKKTCNFFQVTRNAESAMFQWPHQTGRYHHKVHVNHDFMANQKHGNSVQLREDLFPANLWPLNGPNSWSGVGLMDIWACKPYRPEI